ncbi:MAG TPA: LysE family transporter [Gammaproteobacteria bacterium]|nr:LysE family transporter [Gammaproteobacteria bacterium]
MFMQFLSIGLMMLFSAMLPGPDFALVTKNTLLYSRRAGICTTFGIVAGALVHISYCALGLAVVISNSIILFNIIKYVGACYLIYIGITSLFSRQSKHISLSIKHKKNMISGYKAFYQGFLCNLLNPKATLFFLALFTLVIDADKPKWWTVALGLELLVIVLLWFSLLTFILSHPRVVKNLERAEKYIAKFLGLFLMSFGVALIFIRK